MARLGKAAVLALIAVLLSACSDLIQTRGKTMTATTVSKTQLDTFAQTRTFFGHQSVGGNILSGVPMLYEDADLAPPEVVETRHALAGHGFLAHTFVGTNGDPVGKINDFTAVLDGGMADAVDVAVLKLCYVDITQTTDVDAIFAAYSSAMDRLAKTHPNLRIVYTTVPLTTEPSLKRRIKSLLTGRPPADPADNVARERYNTLVRERYGASGRLFDIARVESTTASAERTTGEYEGSTYYALDRDLAADPGHLNETGSERAAEEFVRVVSG
jgi:ABC-type Fe3+/spermidine/putrescine transport system ATPase subunit